MKPASAPVRHPGDPAYLRHLDYEIGHLAAAARTSIRMQRPAPASVEFEAEVIRGALVLAITIHIRVVANFLERYHLRGDDMLPETFNPGWTPQPILSAAERERINKEIAHLTYRRADPDGEPTPWEFETIHRVLAAAQQFYQQIRRPLPGPAAEVLAMLEELVHKKATAAASSPPATSTS